MGATPYWNRIACTCYAAGGMPLTFTKDDFLVAIVFKIKVEHAFQLEKFSKIKV